MKFRLRRVLPLAGGLVIATSGFAFMASNTVGATGVGSGVGAVSGYTINHISYNPNTGGPGCNQNGEVCQVSFQAWPANAGEPGAAASYVRFVNGSSGLTNWENCVFAGTPQAGDAPAGGPSVNGTSWNCNFNPTIGNGNISGLQVRAIS